VRERLDGSALGVWAVPHWRGASWLRGALGPLALVLGSLGAEAQVVPQDGPWCGATGQGLGVYFEVADSGTRVTKAIVEIAGQFLGQPTSQPLPFDGPIVGGLIERHSEFPGYCQYFSSLTGVFATATTASGSGWWSQSGGVVCAPGSGSDTWSAQWMGASASAIADLAVELSAPAAPPVAGERRDFALTLRNLGPAAVACGRLLATGNAELFARLNSGSNFDGIWVGPPLGAGSEVTGVVQAVPAVDATGEFEVTVMVDAIGATDPVSANNAATVRVPLVSSADLTAILSGPSYVSPSSKFSYVVWASQRGPSMARNTRVELLTSPPLTLTGAWVGSDPYLTPCASPCVLGDLRPGDLPLQFDFEIPPGVVPPRSIEVTATVRSDTTDPVPGNDRASMTTTLLPEAPSSFFHTVTPCRILDTRPSGPRSLCGFQEVEVTGASCGIPTTAVAVALNIAVTGPVVEGHLTLAPAGFPPPLASTLNFGPGQTRASNAVVRLPPTGRVALRVGPSDLCVDAIVDVNGYFE